MLFYDRIFVSFEQFVVKKKVRESYIINIKNNLNIMNAKLWKTIIGIVINILTAIAATITTTSCMGVSRWPLF